MPILCYALDHFDLPLMLKTYDCLNMFGYKISICLFILIRKNLRVLLFILDIHYLHYVFMFCFDIEMCKH